MTTIGTKTEPPAEATECGATASTSRRRTRQFKLAAVVLSSALSLMIGEIVLRLCAGPGFALYQDERSLMYRYDATLGWFPVENSKNLFTGFRTITAAHNSRGFRGPEP